MSFFSNFFGGNNNNETTQALSEAVQANEELRQKVEDLSAQVNELTQTPAAPSIEMAPGVSVVTIRFITKAQTVSQQVWAAEYAGAPVKKLLSMFVTGNTDDVSNVTLQFADSSTSQLKLDDILPENTPVQVVISQTSGSGASA